MKLRVATYNLLNTKDRYPEREGLLKQILFNLDADLVGLQEVVFGPAQLDELSHRQGKRHVMPKEGRINSYSKFEAQIQNEVFGFMKHPDVNARIDGNAVLVADNTNEGSWKVERTAVMHLSGVRNCQLVKLVFSQV